VIDAADADWASQWKWSLQDGYAVRGAHIAGHFRTFRLHRELLGLVHGDGVEGDHRDRDKMNCRRANLRPATKPLNAQNVPSYRGATSAYRGVYWSKGHGKWGAHVRIKGKGHHLGFFDSEQTAAEAAREGRARLLPFAVD
jgi:hypothetical protein